MFEQERVTFKIRIQSEKSTECREFYLTYTSESDYCIAMKNKIVTSDCPHCNKSVSLHVSMTPVVST
jgi:hypothetical protein